MSVSSKLPIGSVPNSQVISEKSIAKWRSCAVLIYFLLLCTKKFFLFTQCATPSFSTVRMAMRLRFFSCQQRFQHVITTINPAFTTSENERILHRQRNQQRQSSNSFNSDNHHIPKNSAITHLQFVLFSSASFQQSPFPGMCNLILS